MEKVLTLFITTFTTLVAVINPLEALPIYLMLLSSQDEEPTAVSPDGLASTPPSLCFSFWSSAL
jgi:hypothetical protein